VSAQSIWAKYYRMCDTESHPFRGHSEFLLNLHPFTLPMAREVHAMQRALSASFVRSIVDKQTFVQGHAKFTSSSTVEVNGQTLSFATAVIATGANARIPNTPGINSVPYLTNVSFWNQTELPGRLLVMGSGPIGMTHQHSCMCSIPVLQFRHAVLQFKDYA